jgi:photosystem II stability/assembly factor-like uncharacterized protein
MLIRGKWFGAMALVLASGVLTFAQSWKQVGPPGGDVISLAADPHNPQKLYLGTSDGHVFDSSDEGGHWQLLSRIGTGHDAIVTHILVDERNSNRLYASTWTLYSGGGGVYESDDTGKSWRLVGLAKETVRALAQAPSNPNTLVAGSLTGVYRSKNDGKTWERIAPATNDNLRNFDSVAFDPHDENIIYAGTYHLPWKTTDGGKSWTSIKAGMIDDSDVMSIIVDPANPSNVHATACSGIYHSLDSGVTWKRYGGIPFVYRRTQVIRQDPQDPNTLYAATTSGLWKTTNEGAEWKRVTPLNWIVNALYIDPKNPQKVIIGTQREGVRISDNGGETFAAANNGFHHQHILDVAMDPVHPERTLVELSYDTDAFLETKDGGANWTTLGPGLRRAEVLHVFGTPTGWWASLNRGGLMKYEEGQAKWVRTGLLLSESASGSHHESREGESRLLAYRVNDLAFSGRTWFAATAEGLLESHDNGAGWKSAGSQSFLRRPAQSLDASNDSPQVWAVSGNDLLYSGDAGAHWNAREIPFAEAGNLRLFDVSETNLFIATNMGLYVSHDSGRDWSREEISDLRFQSVAGNGSALLVSLQNHGLLESTDAGKSWHHLSDPLADGFFPMLQTQRNGTVIAASSTEGILALQPGSSSAKNGGSSALWPTSDFQKPRK